MKKKLLTLLLAASMVLGMTACGGKDVVNDVPAPVATEAPAAAEPTEASADVVTPAQDETVAVPETVYPVTIKDQAGREVTIESEPAKVVSGYYISTSIVWALGAKDRLVGIEAKADKRAIYKTGAPELIELPNVGTAKEFNLEGCLALNPDLVILPKKLKDAAASLEEFGIKTILVNPESTELFNEALTILGTALNCNDVAEELIQAGANMVAEVAANVAGKDAPSVYFAGNSSLLSTAGAKMYQNDLITNAGATNVAAELEDSYWVEVSYEQVNAWNPDVIIVSYDAEYSVESILEDENLSEVNAVKNKRVYSLAGASIESWDSPVPSSVFASKWIAGQIFEGAVSEEEVLGEVKDFYNKYYGFTY